MRHPDKPVPGIRKEREKVCPRMTVRPYRTAAPQDSHVARKRGNGAAIGQNREEQRDNSIAIPRSGDTNMQLAGERGGED